MLGALFTTGCANMMLFFATQSFSGWMVESMIRVASDTVFVTSMRGCLSDVLKGPELTVSAARVATYAGIGICVGPILASRVIMPLISRRYTFVMNACLFWLLTGWVAAKLPETLPPEDRTPWRWSSSNPFSLVQLFCNGGRLRTLCTIAMVDRFAATATRTGGSGAVLDICAHSI